MNPMFEVAQSVKRLDDLIERLLEAGGALAEEMEQRAQAAVPDDQWLTTAMVRERAKPRALVAAWGNAASEFGGATHDYH